MLCESCVRRVLCHESARGLTIDCRYLPVMISRLMLSLKKAAESQQNGWSLGDPSVGGNDPQSLKFYRPQRATTFGDDIQLDAHPESQVEVN